MSLLISKIAKWGQILIFYFSHGYTDQWKNWITAGQWQGRDLNESILIFNLFFIFQVLERKKNKQNKEVDNWKRENKEKKNKRKEKQRHTFKIGHPVNASWK